MDSPDNSRELSKLKENFPIFNCLSSVVLKDLVKMVSWFKTNEGNSLFQQGAPGLGVYLLLEGEIEQHHLTPQGKKLIFKLSGPGEVIGTETLFNKENHIATAEIITDVAHVGFLERNSFFEFMDENPALLFNFAKQLSTECMAYKLKLVESSYYGSKQRISRLILAGNKSRLELTRAKLAYLSGVSYKTTIQVLSELEDRKFIETDNHSIAVKDEDALSKLAHNFPLDLDDEGLL